MQELPLYNYRNSKESRINDEELSSELQCYLHDIGKYICTQDIIEFTKKDDIQKKYDLTKPISLATVKRWMVKLGYRWIKELKG